MKNSIKTVALIPAYNEGGSIANVVLGARRYVDRVIVCDDGSTDKTFMIAEALGARVIKHDRNRGKGDAFRTLSKEVSKLNPDFIVTLDGDGQHDPDDIPILLKPIERGESDVVVGSRYVEGSNTNAPLYRRFGLHVINFLYKKVAGVKINDTQSGFRAYSYKAFRYMMNYTAKGYGIEGEQLALAAKNGLRVTEVPVSVNYRGSTPTSKKSPLVHGADLLSTLFRLVVEEKPLRYLGAPGIAMTVIGAMFGLFLLWKLNETMYFSIPLAILALGTFLVGLLLVIAAIILYGLKRMSEKINRFKSNLNH